MKILLRHNVDKVGKRGEVVSVKAGYARNFLIPRGLAAEATAGGIKQFEFERKRLEREEAEYLASLKDVMDKLAAFSLTIEMNANEEGHLYGAVTPALVSRMLNQAGFDLESRQVRIDEPIKELGIYQVPIAFEGDARVEIKVWVVEAKESVNLDEELPAETGDADTAAGDEAPETPA